MCEPAQCCCTARSASRRTPSTAAPVARRTTRAARCVVLASARHSLSTARSGCNTCDDAASEHSFSAHILSFRRCLCSCVSQAGCKPNAITYLMFLHDCSLPVCKRICHAIQFDNVKSSGCCGVTVADRGLPSRWRWPWVSWRRTSRRRGLPASRAPRQRCPAPAGKAPQPPRAQKRRIISCTTSR